MEDVVVSHLAKIGEVGYATISDREVNVVSLKGFVGYEVKHDRGSGRLGIRVGKMRRVIRFQGMWSMLT